MSSFSDKVKAILSGDPPSKKKAATATKAASLVDKGASEADKKVAQKALPVLQAMKAYTSSPTYLSRLKGMQVENPEAVQAARLKELGNVRFQARSGANSNSQWWRDDKPGGPGKMGIIEMDPDATPYTNAHELGHQTARPAVMQKALGQSPFTATGSSLSPVEALQFFNNARMPKENYQQAHKAYQDSATQGYYHSDPGTLTSGIDPHGREVGEFYGDLQSLRYLLYEKGITDSFGKKIDQATLEDALKRPEVKQMVEKDKTLQRLFSKFPTQKIVDLNNTIAQKGGESSNLA
jgi:hypothetical protein